MKKKSKNYLRFNKSVISNLKTIVAGGPPVPPGSNTCMLEETCLTYEGYTCNEKTCGEKC